MDSTECPLCWVEAHARDNPSKNPYKHWRTPKLEAELAACRKLRAGNIERLKQKRLPRAQRGLLEMGIERYDSCVSQIESVLKKRRKKKRSLGDNPGNPIPWTECELNYPSVQEKMESCVLKAKGMPGIRDPHAVCRAVIPCPPKGAVKPLEYAVTDPRAIERHMKKLEEEKWKTIRRNIRAAARGGWTVPYSLATLVDHRAGASVATIRKVSRKKSGNPDENLEEVTIVHRLDNPGNPGNPDTREIERELAERGIIF